MVLRCTSLFALAALAAAQSPSPGKSMPMDGPRPGALAAAPASPSEWLEPRVDTDANGTVWVAGPTYKAQFRPTGVQFLPFLGSDLPANVTLDLTLDSVRLCGRDQAIADTAPRLGADVVDYDRGACRETFRLGKDGLEQLFTFDQLPQRGDLALAIRVATPLHGETRADGVAFAHERGAVRYTGAVAIDARGRRLALPTTLDGDHIRFAVPAAFVAEAALPLLIDPLISTVYSGPVPTYQFTGSDLAFDASANEWQVVWSYLFSATDSDIVCQRFDGTWSPLGSTFTIDQSLDSWTQPSIANLSLYDKFLVVAQELAGGTTRIAGRITAVGGTTPLTAQFDIEGPGAAGNLGVEARNPDVGGDAGTAAPTYWTVVYEVGTGFNGDIHARQVTDAGVLRGAAPIAVATTTADERRPAISKSNGKGTFGSQAWGIVFSSDVWQIRGRSLTWNGAPIGQIETLFYGLAAGGRFDVSPPTEDVGGQRQMLLTFEYDVSAQSSTDICGVLLDRAMAPQANPISLTDLALSATENAHAQTQPSVSCDGVRFVVAYRHDFSAPDYDLFAAVFHAMPGVLGGLRCVQSDVIANSFQPEGEPRVCAIATGNGGRLLYGMLWQYRATVAGNQLQAAVYEGRRTGTQYNVRSTGCGGLGITYSGSSFAGEQLNVQVTNGSGLVGMVVGFPASMAVPGCPGCTQGVQDYAAVLSSQYSMTMPTSGAFVGFTLSFQGFSFGAGPCLSQVSLGATLDATIL